MIDELPEGPDPAIDPPGQFSQKAAASVLAQKRAFQQFNAEVATLNALFAGGAYSFMYTFDSVASNADPGSGRLRMNSGTQSSANNIYIDPVTVGGANIDDLLGAIGANMSQLKGAIRIVKASDPSRWALYDINAVVASSGYRSLGVTWRAGSSGSPFVNNDAVMVFLDRTGDRALDQSAYVLLAPAVVVSSAVANVEFSGIFSSLYDKIVIELIGLSPTANGSPQIALNSGVLVISSDPVGAGKTMVGTLEVLSPNGPGIKALKSECILEGPSTNYMVNGIQKSSLSIPVTTVRISFAGTTIAAGKIAVYGVRNVG